ncbi:MAG: hypothetical protein HS129_15480 [Leptospiraceae bacterium]|nr:hypothetical protein [Leptospiraceae bacterium]
MFSDDFHSGDFVPSVLPKLFEEVSLSVGALCGVVVLKIENSESYDEVAGFGYQDGGFFYSFLSGKSSQFELVRTSKYPCQFSSNTYSLYNQDSAFAMVLRIGSQEDFRGFILWEFSGEERDIYSVVMLLFGDKIYSKLSFGNQPFLGNSVNSVQFEAMENIVKMTPGLSEKFQESLKWRYFLVSGSVGVGKKTFSKYYNFVNFPSKKILILNSIPEQIVKLEKSLEEWLDLSSNGILVFENIYGFSLGQQRFFFEKFSENTTCTMIFLDSKLPKNEIYPPFWEYLNQRLVNLPDLDSMEKALFVEVLKSMFREVLYRHQKRNYILTEEAINVLKLGNYQQNLRELRNVLEHAMLSAKSEKIGVEEVSFSSKSGLKTIGSQDIEDMNIRRCVLALERQKILLANKLFSGNQIRMAKALGISRGSLQYKMKKMELL